MYTPSRGGCVMSFSSVLLTRKSHDNPSIDTLFLRADVCRTAVRKPVGYVKPPSQYTFGYEPSAHSRKVSILCASSRYHADKFLTDGYAFCHAGGTCKPTAGWGSNGADAGHYVQHVSVMQQAASAVKNTFPSSRQLKTSSRSKDMTTSPLMPCTNPHTGTKPMWRQCSFIEWCRHLLHIAE